MDCLMETVVVLVFVLLKNACIRNREGKKGVG